MISPINNSVYLPVYNKKQVVFNANNGEITKTEKFVNNTIKEKINKFNISMLLKSAAKLFGRDLKFDDYGKIKEIYIYKDGQIEKVKHYSGRLIRPKSVDEYKGGIISKTIDYYENSRTPHWVMEYNSSGYDYTREFYKNGCEKSFQVEKDNKLISIAYFDKYGNYKRGEKFDSDEIISSAVSYKKYETPGKVHVSRVEESYNNGFLTSKSERFLGGDSISNTVYNENGKIKYKLESNKESNTYYYYDNNGKKSWSETRYKNNKFLYKKVVYDEYGNPKTEELYDKNRILRKKIEYDKDKTKDIRYSTDGKIIYTDITDNKTKKTEHILNY